MTKGNKFDKWEYFKLYMSFLYHKERVDSIGNTKLILQQLMERMDEVDRIAIAKQSKMDELEQGEEQECNNQPPSK